MKNEDQRKRNAMVTMLDEAIGNLTQMIKDVGIADNTVLIFSSDNGPCIEFQSCQNIEFNLHDRLGQFRGSKGDDIFEGGTLVPGFINSPLLPKSFETNGSRICHMNYSLISNLAMETLILILFGKNVFPSFCFHLRGNPVN